MLSINLVIIAHEELVNMQDDEGNIAADYLEGKHQEDLIEEALKKDPLYHASLFGMGIDAVKKILKIGGKEMALTRFMNCKTALHATCEFNGDQSSIIEYLVLFGGEKLVAMQDDEGKTAAEYKEGACKDTIERKGRPNSSDDDFHGIRQRVLGLFLILWWFSLLMMKLALMKLYSSTII